MLNHNQDIGRLGEDYAASHLEKGGYKIICRNYRAGRFGEIDIIAVENTTLVFVEVKTRISARFGNPEEAITPRKLRTLQKAALYFGTMYPEAPEARRVDVVSVKLKAETLKPHQITVFKNVTF